MSRPPKQPCVMVALWRTTGSPQAGGQRSAARTAGQGFTLVEMVISFTILSVVLTVVVPIAVGLFTQRTNVQNTFLATDTVVLASEELGTLFHDAVATCSPATTGTCTDANGELPFAAASDTSATFFANVGNANGPAEIVLTSNASTLSATEYLPTAGTCPVMGSLGGTCTYPANGKTVVSVHYLINTTGAQLTNNPPFSYVLAPGAASCPVTGLTYPLTTANIENLNAVCVDLLAQVPGGVATGYTSQEYLVAPSGGLAPGITNYNEAVG